MEKFLEQYIEILREKLLTAISTYDRQYNLYGIASEILILESFKQEYERYKLEEE